MAWSNVSGQTFIIFQLLNRPTKTTEQH